jgi:hypothetical protein
MNATTTHTYYSQDKVNAKQLIDLWKGYMERQITYSNLIDFAYGHGLVNLLDVLNAMFGAGYIDCRQWEDGHYDWWFTYPKCFLSAKPDTH